MQFEQQQELASLINKAADMINAVAESGSFRNVFSFWRLPSFGNHTRTTLYKPRRPDSDLQPFFAVTTWRRDVDADKLRDPVERLKYSRVLEPTIEESVVHISPDLVESIIEELAEISLPVLRPAEGGLHLDGTGSRFSFSQGFYALDLFWHVGSPECWQEAVMKIEEVVSKLENHKNQKLGQAVK